ncbi:hypothetical protein H5P29_25660 [Aminobacter sp. MDW-2]|nr:hypothetical protein [Aminobacter sp. MDW-2]QNH33834.1 hypothetical protein H5P29_25660 [Aminobacter sp. MDW-2]
MSFGSVQAWVCGSFAHPRVDDTAASPGNSRAGLGEVVRTACVARRGLRSGTRQYLCTARFERGGQDNGGENPVHSAQGGRWRGQYRRLRCRPATAERARGHQYGAAFDDPDLVVACVIGDCEAEAGKLAASWHSNKFMHPADDGVVLATAETGQPAVIAPGRS